MQGNRLERMNSDRNDIAHGRVFRSFEQIREDLVNFICLDKWHHIMELVGCPIINNLKPWVISIPFAYEINPGQKEGVFEKWGTKKWTYIIPETGRIIQIDDFL